MDPVEEIKSRLTIDDLVGRYVELKRSGASLKGLCPFHQEKSPSFYVTPSRGTYHCFGCGKGGDVFSFLMEMERLTFPDALKTLAEQAGVTLPDRETVQPSLKKQLYEANEAAATFYRKALGSGAGAHARRYLAERVFDREAIEMFELGVATESRDSLLQYLRHEGIEDRISLAAGLAFQDDSGTVRDRFHGRLMLPIRDPSGKITGFGGRTMGDAQPKYLNSPQTEIFDKSSVLYGVHLAGIAIREAGRAALVEGYFDAVRAHRAGFAWTVASLGTAVTVPQLTALSRLTGTVVLALDPDPAGQAAAARTSLTALAELTRNRGRAQGESGALDLRVATLPTDAGDPDELIRDHPERWQLVVGDSIPAFEFYFRQTMESLDRSADTWRQHAIDRLLPLIQQFSDSAGWQATWIERLGRETGIDPSALQRVLPGAASPRQRRINSARAERGRDVVAGATSHALTADPALAIEEALLALLLKVVVLPTQVSASLAEIKLQGPEHQAILDYVRDWAHTGNFDYEMLRESLPEVVRTRADELRKADAPLPEENRVNVGVAYHVARLNRVRLQTQLVRVSETLADVDSSGMPAAIAALGRLNDEQQRLDQLLNDLSLTLLKASTGGL